VENTQSSLTAGTQLFKRFHVLGTGWFILCALYLLIIAMLQAGLKWWVVFSFSGYMLIISLFLLNVYLFVIFRGVSRIQNALEHPLTTSIYYIAFYDLCPFLGSIAGIICYLTSGLGQNFLTAIPLMCEGTLSFTFLVWIVSDPLLGMIELMLPECAHYRRVRIQAAAEEKRQKQIENKKLLENLEKKEAEDRRIWTLELEPLADQAAQILNQSAQKEKARDIVLRAGARAWQLGGLVCMRYFHQLVRQKISPSCPDFVAIWWDGIGNWRTPPLHQAIRSSCK
jgi:hypothetical protein